MTTLTATTARKDFFEMVKGAAEGHRTYRIQHKRGTVVLMSEEDYEGLLETLELLSQPDFRKRLKASSGQMIAGDTIAMHELFGTKS